MTGKAVVATLALGLLGATCGASMIVLVPDGGLFADDRARLAVRGGTDAALVAAIDVAGDDVGLAAVAALAHVLRAREHAAGDAERVAAERALSRAGAAQKSPEGLYARALLKEAGANDPTLAADVAAGGEDAWVLLAKARLAADDDRQGLVERAAFSASPTAHATHALVREALLAGDVDMAKAALTRLQRLAPEHAGGVMSALLVAAAEDQALPEKKRAFRPAREKGDGPAGPPPPRPEFKAAADVADASDDVDRAMLSVWLFALHTGDGREIDKGLVDRVVTASGSSADVAELALVVALGTGNVELANRIVAAQKSVERVSLLALVSRARFMAALDGDELRAAAKGPRAVDSAGITLPFATLAFDARVPGVPLRPVLSSTHFPERRYQRLLANIRAGGKRYRLDERFRGIEQLGLVDRALARGDFGVAENALKKAGELLGADPHVSLAEAGLAARRGDAAGTRAAVEAAIAAAGDDGAASASASGANADADVLLDGADIALDVDSLSAARKALAAFSKLKLKSARASALGALLDAKSGDIAGAKSALADVKKMGGGADPLSLRASVYVGRSVDVADARAAADLLLKSGAVPKSDVVAAWVAEASYRQGDQARAEAALSAITTSNPTLGDAQLFYANCIRFSPSRKKEALAALAVALKRLERGPLLDEAKELYAVLTGKAQKPRRRGR